MVNCIWSGLRQQFSNITLLRRFMAKKGQSSFSTTFCINHSANNNNNPTPSQSEKLNSIKTSESWDNDIPLIPLREDVQSCYDVLRVYEPYNTPWRLDNTMRQQLNDAKTANQRYRLLYNYGLNERDDIKDTVKDLARKASYQEYLRTRGEYELPNTIFLWTRPKHIAEWRAHNLIHGDRFGNDLVVDCRYEHMLKRNTLLQSRYLTHLGRIIRFNSESTNPFRLWFCNVTDNSVLYDEKKRKSAMFPVFSLERITSQSYLDLFPRRDLCYLSPDTRHSVVGQSKQSSNTVFIIGGLPDMGGEFSKETFAVAKEEGVRSCSLPIKRYLRCRGNCMPMDAVFKAMKIYDNSGDMCVAIHDSYAPRLVFSYLYPDGSARHVRDSPDPSGGQSRGQLVHGFKHTNSSPQLNETKAPRDKPAEQRNVMSAAGRRTGRNSLAQLSSCSAHVRDAADPSGGQSWGQLVRGLKDTNSSPQLRETKAPRDKPAVQRNVGNSSAANKAAQWDSLTSVRRGHRK